MFLLFKKIDAGKDGKIEMAAQKLQSRLEIEPEIKRLRHEEPDTRAQPEAFGRGVIPHLSFS